MIGPLYGLITRGATQEEIARWIEDRRASHFGLPADPEADAALARRLLLSFSHGNPT
jgi:hypothetical protein